MVKETNSTVGLTPLVTDVIKENDYTEVGGRSMTETRRSESAYKLPPNFVYNATALAVPREVTQDNYNKIFDGRLHPKR